MSGLKTYMDASDGIDENMLFRARSAGDAKAWLANETGEWFTDVRVRRVPYLDRYDDLDSPDAKMAMLRHGWNFSYDCFDREQAICLYAISERHERLLYGDYDIEEFNSDTMHDETEYEIFALAIGAKYPDYYKPKEKK